MRPYDHPVLLPTTAVAIATLLAVGIVSGIGALLWTLVFLAMLATMWLFTKALDH